MTQIFGRAVSFKRAFATRIVQAAAIATIGITSAAFAEAPADLDSPDTAIDTPASAAAVAAADASAARFVRATPALAQIENRGPAAAATTAAATDGQFRSLFNAWQQMDGPQAETIAIPSRRPVDAMIVMSSHFGTRADPFNGRRARHNGIDIPGAIGTPIHATADATVGRAQRLGGYGNYVELEHGNGIETRYGHMSAIAVISGQRVRRGDVIGYMGSTGRSTGSHLHYEVRVAGAPVNPVPFVTDEGAIADASGANTRLALGGPR